MVRRQSEKKSKEMKDTKHSESIHCIKERKTTKNVVF